MARIRRFWLRAQRGIRQAFEAGFFSLGRTFLALHGPYALAIFLACPIFRVMRPHVPVTVALR